MKPISELFREPDSSQRFFWDDLLIVGGLSIVVGRPKAGKSTFIRNLIAATVSDAASQARFLDIALKTGPCIYLALEDDEHEITRRLRALGVRSDAPLYVECGSRNFRADSLALEWLEQQIDATKAVLCVVDPLFRLLRLRSITNYATITQAFEPLARLARSTGCHILAAHHTTKARTKDPMTSILGSTAIFGAVDSAFLIDAVDQWDPRFADFRRLYCRLKYGRGFSRKATRSDPRVWSETAVYKRAGGGDGNERIEEAHQEWWDMWITGYAEECGIEREKVEHYVN